MRDRNDNHRKQKDNVCVPCLSNFSYKSTLAHAGIICGSIGTVSLLFEAAILLVIAQYDSNEYSRQKLMDIGWKVGASGLGGAALTVVGFFAGTTREPPTEADERSELVQERIVGP
jgi:hypothetical protein